MNPPRGRDGPGGREGAPARDRAPRIARPGALVAGEASAVKDIVVPISVVRWCRGQGDRGPHL